MKIFILLLVFPLSAMASDLESRVQALEAKVRALEAKVNGGSTTNSLGIKVKDMNNSSVEGSSGARIPSSGGMTPEQRKEVEEAFKKLKEQQQINQKYLDELDSEDL